MIIGLGRILSRGFGGCASFHFIFSIRLDGLSPFSGLACKMFLLELSRLHVCFRKEMDEPLLWNTFDTSPLGCTSSMISTPSLG